MVSVSFEERVNVAGTGIIVKDFVWQRDGAAAALGNRDGYNEQITIVVYMHEMNRHVVFRPVHGNRIIAVGPTSELEARYPAKRNIDATMKAVLPGLIDGHLHTVIAILRGVT